MLPVPMLPIPVVTALSIIGNWNWQLATLAQWQQLSVEVTICDLKPVTICDRLPTSATKTISFLAGMEGMGERVGGRRLSRDRAERA